jgi:hypothetical protein
VSPRVRERLEKLVEFLEDSRRLPEAAGYSRGKTDGRWRSRKSDCEVREDISTAAKSRNAPQPAQPTVEGCHAPDLATGY